MSSFYLRRNGKLYGPFSEDKLKILINNGTFGEEDQVTSDQISWQSVQDFRITMNIPPYDPAGAQGYDPNYTQQGGYDPNYTQQGGYDPNYAQQGGYDSNYAQQGGYDPNYAQQGGYGPNYAPQGGYGPIYAQPGYNPNYPPSKNRSFAVLGFILAGVIILGIIGIVLFVVFSNKPDSKSSSKASGPAAEKREEPRKVDSKISVSVTVKKWFYMSTQSWKYNCEYKLYADDQLVATRNSTSMSVTFRVKVAKGASLRAEMLPKNGFGAISETLEGPKYKTVTAQHSGESLTIECH